VTGWTAGTNLNVEFNTGSLGNVQLVAGSAVSSYAYRPYGTELALCQRYYQFLAKSSWEPVVAQPSGASAVITCFLKSTMRATPTITLSSITTYTGGTPVVGNSGADAFQISYGAAVGNSQYLTTMSAEL
jgi:hypothetical protein